MSSRSSPTSRRRSRRRSARDSAQASESNSPRSPRRTSPPTTPSSRARRSGTAGPSIPPACGRRPASTSRRWRWIRLCAGVGRGLVRQFASVLQQHAHARAGGACAAGGREGGRARAEPPGRLPGARFLRTPRCRGLRPRPGTVREGFAPRPRHASLLRGTALAEEALGRWDAAVEHFEHAVRLDPRSANNLRVLGDALVRLRRYPEAREALDRGLALAPANLDLPSSGRP